MKNRKAAGPVILALVCSILLLLFSCTRNSGNSSSASSSEVTAAVTGTDTENAKATATKSDDSDEVFAPAPVISEPQVEAVFVEEGLEDTVEVIIADEENEDDEEVAAVMNTADAPEREVETPEDKPFYEGYFSYNGYNSYVIVDNTTASLTIPDGVRRDDIKAVAEMIAASYPQESSLIRYEIADNTVFLTYPEQSDGYLSSVLGFVASEAEAILDKYPLQSEDESASQVEESVTESEEKAFCSQNLSLSGIVTTVNLYRDHATLTLPEEITEEDVVAASRMITEAYPSESSFVTYSLSDRVLTLYYPEQTEDFLLSAINVLETDAVKLISEYRRQNTRNEEPTQEAEVGTPAAEVTVSDAHSETDNAAAEDPLEVLASEEKKEEESSGSVEPAIIKTEETLPSVTVKSEKMRRFSVSAVAEPVYSDGLSTFGVDKFGLSAGLRVEAAVTESIAFVLEGSYDFNKNIEGGAYLRWTIAEKGKADFYVLLGGGGVFGTQENSGRNSFVVRGAFGVGYSFSDLFSLFGEGTVKWSQNDGFGYGGTLGVRFAF